VIALTIMRVAAALAFMVSGFVKLMEPHENFLAVIQRFEILSGWPAEMMAVVLPWGELILGVFLLAGLWTRFSSGGLWFFSSMFSILSLNWWWKIGSPFSSVPAKQIM